MSEVKDMNASSLLSITLANSSVDVILKYCADYARSGKAECDWFGYISEDVRKELFDRGFALRDTHGLCCNIMWL